jgi:hypothetical protein
MKSKNLTKREKELYEKTKEQHEKTKKLFEEGLSLKSEFEKLQYPEKLKFMDKHFGGAPAAGEYPEFVNVESDKEVKYSKSDIPPIINVWPKEADHYQIRLYNEWKIKLFESLEPSISMDFSFERLKKDFKDHISNIKKENLYPEKAINDYTQDQISIYKEKAQNRDVQLQWKEFGGAWDITKKVINNLGPFLKARAYYNYISFLENQPDKLTDPIEPIIEKMYLELIFKSFKEWFPDETKETWIQRFVYPCEDAINPIKIEPIVKTENNRLILIAVLGAIQDSDKTNFEYSKFVLERFGIKAFKKIKNEHRDKPKFIESYKKCETIMKK